MDGWRVVTVEWVHDLHHHLLKFCQRNRLPRGERVDDALACFATFEECIADEARNLLVVRRSKLVNQSIHNNLEVQFS